MQREIIELSTGALVELGHDGQEALVINREGDDMSVYEWEQLCRLLVARRSAEARNAQKARVAANHAAFAARGK